MKEHPTMAAVSLTDADRSHDLPHMLTVIANMLDSEQPDHCDLTFFYFVWGALIQVFSELC